MLIKNCNNNNLIEILIVDKVMQLIRLLTLTFDTDVARFVRGRERPAKMAAQLMTKWVYSRVETLTDERREATRPGT